MRFKPATELDSHHDSGGQHGLQLPCQRQPSPCITLKWASKGFPNAQSQLTHAQFGGEQMNF
jgi:hypothetical protein